MYRYFRCTQQHALLTILTKYSALYFDKKKTHLHKTKQREREREIEIERERERERERVADRGEGFKK